MDSRVKGMSRLAAAGAILILASGLAACGSSGAGKPAAGQRAQTPQQAIELAANISRSINTFAATVNVKVNSTAAGAAAAVNLTGTVTERLHPSLIAEADYSSFTAAGHSFPGGMSEVITPTRSTSSSACSPRRCTPASRGSPFRSPRCPRPRGST